MVRRLGHLLSVMLKPQIWFKSWHQCVQPLDTDHYRSLPANQRDLNLISCLLLQVRCIQRAAYRDLVI